MLGGFVAPLERGFGSRKVSGSSASAQTTTNTQDSGGGSTIRAATTISLEYSSLVNACHCPQGIYIVPSTSTLFSWEAVFFVHQGYYADSVLKFRLIFPGNFPDAPPAVQFLTDVFHPLIGKNGSFNLLPRFRPWRPNEHHVFDVLYWIKAAFKKDALDTLAESDCLNKEAFRLYRDSTQSFAALAAQSASLSHSESALFDADHPSPMGNNARSEIVFNKLTPQQLAEERKKLGLRAWDDVEEEQS